MIRVSQVSPLAPTERRGQSSRELAGRRCYGHKLEISPRRAELQSQRPRSRKEMSDETSRISESCRDRNGRNSRGRAGHCAIDAGDQMAAGGKLAEIARYAIRRLRNLHQARGR